DHLTTPLFLSFTKNMLSTRLVRLRRKNSPELAGARLELAGAR
ncbi:hypothetical protein A2U01_0092898, partial [Trifolium medium]|nr:hypothetical protein [Trifolium medium]